MSTLRSRRAFVQPAVALSLLALTALGIPALIPLASPRPEVKVGRAAMTWKDVTGKTYGQAEVASAKATVFFFSGNDCPIAAKYVNRMNEIAKDYQAKGIQFFLVNSNASDTLDAVKKYAAERKFVFPAVKDNGTALADVVGASVTPEAAIMDSTGEVRYLGRIDDNTDREKVTRSEVREALDLILTGKPVVRNRTRATGCAIFRDAPSIATTSSANAKVTYARDIAPLLNKNCVTCHRKGDVGPFALDSYQQAKLWSSAIKDYTARRIMPPWKADPALGGPFHDTRYLTDADIAKIATWADTGTPMGNKKDIPPVPAMYPAGDWPLGKPDLVLTPDKAYHLDAEGKDVYRNFALSHEFTEDTYVKAMDFKPMTRSIVHHIIAYIDLTGETVKAKEGKESEPGWSVSGGGSGIKDDDWGSGWAPGMNMRRLPEGIAVKIPKGAKLVLQVHYHKSGKPEIDQTTVGLYLAKEPIQDVLRTTVIGNPFFALEPGKVTTVTAPMKITSPIKIYAALPHMHMLGKTMTVTATLPDGTTKPIIGVKNWEFNWQMDYHYIEPIRLPKGTLLTLTATYDNTAQNPNQMSLPPQLVKFGEQTTDEMCFCFFGVVRDREAEAEATKKVAIGKEP